MVHGSRLAQIRIFSSLFHHTPGAWTHAYKPPHLPETSPIPTNRGRLSCVLKCAWVSDHTVPSAGIGGRALLDGTRQCSLYVQYSTRFARNSRSFKATRRLEIAELGIWSCAILPRLSSEYLRSRNRLLYGQLSRMSTSGLHKISLLPSL